MHRGDNGNQFTAVTNSALSTMLNHRVMNSFQIWTLPPSDEEGSIFCLRKGTRAKGEAAQSAQSSKLGGHKLPAVSCI